MRSPFDNTTPLTDEDKERLNKIAEHIQTTYGTEIMLLAHDLTGKLDESTWTFLATLISTGYSLRMHETEELEDSLFKMVNNDN